jgi:hypothetical protein
MALLFAKKKANKVGIRRKLIKLEEEKVECERG